MTHVLTHDTPGDARKVRSMRRVGLLILAGALLAGCGSGSSSSTSANVGINATVLVYDVTAYIRHCRPGSGFGAHDDVGPGDSVTVTDAEGTVVGSTTLHPLGQTGGRTFSTEGCSYRFSVSVPSSPFYGIQVGSHNKVTYPLAKASSGPTLTLDAN